MARHLPIPANDSEQERESSADPLDLISPPRPEPIPLPPTSSSRPKSTSGSSSRSRSKRNSTVPSRSSSRSASPTKGSTEISRGRGRGGAKTRGSGSTSRSPEKKVVNRIIHRSEPVSNSDTDGEEEGGELEEEEGLMTSAQRKVKRRRIHSESEDGGDRPSATVSPRIQAEETQEEENGGDTEAPSEILPGLEGGIRMDGIEEVEIESMEDPMKQDNNTAQEDTLADPSGQVEDGMQAIPDEQGGIEIEENQGKEESDIQQLMRTHDQPNDAEAIQTDTDIQEDHLPIQEDAAEQESIELGHLISSPAAHTNILPSATIGPISAADSSTETTSLAEQSGEYALEPKDVVTEQRRMDEEDQDVTMIDAAQEIELPSTSTEDAGNAAKDQPDADISIHQPVSFQADCFPTEVETAAEEEVVKGNKEGIEPLREVELPGPVSNSEEVLGEKVKPLVPVQSMEEPKQQMREVVQNETVEQMEMEPTNDHEESGPDKQKEQEVVKESTENIDEQLQDEKMDVDETSPSKVGNTASTHRVDKEERDEGEMKIDPTAQSQAKEAEGEVELDPMPHTEEVQAEREGEGEMEIESNNLEEASDTPAPSSPAKSIAASQASTSTTKPAKKPSAANNKKKLASTASKKSSTPLSTGSASGSAKKGAGAAKGKGKTKVEELKGTSSSKPKSKSGIAASSEPPLTPTTPTRPSSLSANSPSLNPYQSPDKNAIYCVCRKPYSEEEDEVMMVGCESCDNWFHPGCVGLTEDMVEALDVYICKSCERSTHQRTIYKQLCKREGCSKSLAGSSSKFCSSSCAFQYSQSILSSMSNKNTLKQLAKTFIGYPQPRLGISTITHNPESTIISSGSKSDRLVELEKQLANVNRSIELVNKRQRILDQVIVRAENAMLAPNGNEVEEEEEVVHSKKGKKKKGAMNGGGKDDKPCGWDRVLIADDEEVPKVENGVNEENGNAEDQRQEGLCMRGKRRCDRHQGWQRTIAAQLEIELSGLERCQKNLTEYIDGLKSTSKIRFFTDEIRLVDT
uniref:PHD-type domain-containing protein n=1 Tax=Kwoniella bestiolae CBS 10118 TaxID=1296100 RepID=A0A1B9FYE2_9TREE|nr:hypothetical protein I302_06773 [Kwoniella bestiolae CBS 10118]OCF23789.1 hypothetical protein I302_06773 [Kwoniella bestiolae CBS 10118]